MVDAKTEAEIMRQICNTDWRSTRPSLIDRFKCVCLSEEYSDVDFVFNKGLSGEVKIPAHSLILTFASEVFEKLFAYDKKETMIRQQIVIKDEKLKADTVRNLLKFIYSDFNDVADINMGNVWDVIYAAKLYMVASLEKYCVEFLTENLSQNNVFEILDQCLKWTVNAGLLFKCKEFLQKQTKEVLKCEGFHNISLEHLVILLEQETLSVSEGELLKSVLEWAKCACKAADIESTPYNLRKKLGEKAFSLIRFPTISKKDFIKVVLPSKIFSMQEQHDLMLMMAFDGASIENPPPFSKTPRKRMLSDESAPLFSFIGPPPKVHKASDDITPPGPTPFFSPLPSMYRPRPRNLARTTLEANRRGDFTQREEMLRHQKI